MKGRNAAGFGMLSSVVLFMFVLLCLGCQIEKMNLEGKWERFDDPAAGSILHVTKKGNQYIATLLHVAEPLQGSGFQVGDIKWKDIQNEAEAYYEGNDLLKATDNEGNIVKREYEPVFFELLTYDILKVSSYNEGNQQFGNKQKWKRIR